MATPDYQDTIVRVGCGAVLGLFVGLAMPSATGKVEGIDCRGGTVVAVVGVSLWFARHWALRFGDRFFQALHKWIGWLWLTVTDSAVVASSNNRFERSRVVSSVSQGGSR